MHIIYFSTITSSFDMDKKKQSFLRWVAVSSSYDETEIKHDNPDNSQLWDFITPTYDVSNFGKKISRSLVMLGSCWSLDAANCKAHTQMQRLKCALIPSRQATFSYAAAESAEPSLPGESL